VRYHDLPGDIAAYEMGGRTVYVKTGVRNFVISEDDVTPEELVSIAKDIAARRAKRPEPQVETICSTMRS